MGERWGGLMWRRVEVRAAEERACHELAAVERLAEQTEAMPEGPRKAFKRKGVQAARVAAEATQAEAAALREAYVQAREAAVGSNAEEGGGEVLEAQQRLEQGLLAAEEGARSEARREDEAQVPSCCGLGSIGIHRGTWRWLRCRMALPSGANGKASR
jgi:hypothetical protein